MARSPGVTNANTHITTQMSSVTSISSGATERSMRAAAATTPAQHSISRLSLGLLSSRRCIAEVPATTATAASAVPTPVITPRQPGPTPNWFFKKNGTSTLMPSTEPVVNASPIHW